MGLTARSFTRVKYSSDDGDVKFIRVRNDVRAATSSWNTEPTGTADDKDSAIISKSTRRSGQRPRYFLYGCTLSLSGISTTLYLKVAVLQLANYNAPPGGSDTVTFGGQVYNRVKSVAEDND
jgi:hypothetical protein